MKTYLIFIYLFVAIISFSCSESFAPEAPFIERYVLNCVVRGDSLIQVAQLGKTYNVNGANPLSNNVDPSISDAPVFITWRGKTFQMRDSSMARTDTSRYKDPVQFYYTNAFVPSFNDSISITATPANGVVLTSSTKVPNGVIFKYLPAYVTPDTYSLGLSWIESDPGCLFLPRLVIQYYIRKEVPQVLHQMEIPLTYNEAGGVKTPIFPIISQSSGLEFLRTMIDDYLLKVSVGDDKDNYQIIGLRLDLLVFDQFMAGYISTTNGFLDNLSIRLDEPNYSNINGGLGIFGSYIYNNITIGLSDDYLISLGYFPQ